ncbi:MAG TPA: hypothetical protein VFU14_01375 [Acidimicrobiales bacterium]|nr:hypothetical protein [Acidimicrobiales bacterium]
MVRLRVDEHQVVELHPAVTVVTGLDEAQRVELRRTFAAVASGLAPATTGLLEAHGVLLDLDQGALDLLEVAEVPSDAVLTPAHVPGAVPDEVAERLRVAERDVRVLAAAHRRAAAALEAWDARLQALDDPDGDSLARRRRADALGLALDLHRATDPEPVRAAVDAVHDAERSAPGVAVEPVARLADSLADVGIDVRSLDLPDAEVLRIAEEWSDEVRRRGSWAIGAAVELQGLEARLTPADASDDERAEVSAAVARSRDAAADARRVHADALLRADHARDAARLAATPAAAADLEGHLLGRLAEQRQARLAGAVPVVLDEVFGAVPDDQLGPLLDRLAQLAGGVQLVVSGDDPRPAEWGRAADPLRVAVVAPGAGAGIGALR